VREIYTGYTGTITGKYYQDYEKKFNKLLDELIAEPAPASAVNVAGNDQKELKGK
jgi:hypothetical protein